MDGNNLFTLVLYFLAEQNLSKANSYFIIYIYQDFFGMF